MAAIDESGNVSYDVDTVTVTGDVAPDISFTVDENRCIANANTFTSVSSTPEDIVSYSWDFGDGEGTSSQSDTSYQYTFPGTYEVLLEIISSGGCRNLFSQELTVYPEPPTPKFTIDYSSLCTNNELEFVNTTDTAGYGDALVFEWVIGGDVVTKFDTVYTFDTPGDHQISLQVFLPGCESAITDTTISISEGPAVNFSYSNNCFGEAVQFSSEVEGSEISSYSWDFGDGEGTSSAADTVYEYATAGTYNVSLTVFNDGGCVTEYESSITVNDQPLVNVLYGEIEEDAPVTFTGEDLTLSGDSVKTWVWNIEGQEERTEQSPSVIFTSPGEYQVQLTIETFQGCTDTFEALIEVDPAACPSSEIIINSSDVLCLGETLGLTNGSVNATAYRWDFCSGELGEMPVSQLIKNSGTVSPSDMAYGNDGQNWYGFITERTNNRLYRLEFGASISNIPVVKNLNNPSGLLSSPDRILLHEEGGHWYGLMTNDQVTNNLIFLDFGVTLDNTPTATSLGNYGGKLNRPRGMSLQESGGDLILVVVNRGDNTVALLNFGTSITNTVSSESVLKSGAIPSSNVPLDLSIGKDCDSWYGFTVSAGNGNLHRLLFGNSLYQIPTFETINLGLSSLSQVELRHDGTIWRGLISGNSGFYRLDFTSGLGSSPETVSFASLGLSNISGISMLADSVGFLIDNVSQDVYRLDFDNGCSSTIKESTSYEPIEVSYGSSGTYYVSLAAIDESGNVSYDVDTVTVTGDVAPDISFTVDENRCIANANTFTSVSSTPEDIVSYSWDFNGDGIEDSSEPNPTYRYSVAGDYTIVLTIGDSSSCGNTAKKTITIYPGPPEPDFSTDQTTYCVGDGVFITNLADDSDYGDGVSYYWSTELGDTVSTSPVFNFDQPGEKTISLYSSIPGCDSEIITKTVTILPLPEIAFQADTACHGEFTEFTNFSEGTSFAWTFGDGFISKAENPEHFYTEPGLYDVTVSNVDENGCENFLAKQVIVGAIPEPEFEYDIACQGDETILSDVSIVNGADIVEWEWYIEDIPVSQDKNPGVYFDREGSQTVTMTVFSSNGCSATYSESIEVLGQPQVDFSITKACQGDFSSFVDQTKNPDQIISRTWQINGVTQASDDDTLTYAFVEPGLYEVSLMVNNRSLCTAEQVKTLEILALPELDFLIDGVCENEVITVSDQSVAINDAIISRRWLLNGGFVGNGRKIEIPADVSGLHDVTLEVETAFGCMVSHTETLEVYAKPEVAFTPANDFGVPPFSLVFENETVNGQTYKWYVNGELTSEEMTPSLSFGTEGLQTVKLVATNENGCRDSVSTEIESILPVVDLVVNEIQLIEDGGLQKILLDVSNKSNLPVELFEVQITLENEFTLSENVTKRINKGKEAIIGLSVSLPSVSKLGYLCVSLVAPYNVPDQIPENNEGCINMEARTIFEPAFPNPATDRTHIRMVLPLDGDVELTILDLSGQVKQQKNLYNRPSGLTTFTIDLQTLKSGTYFISIKHNGGTHRARIIKQ
ncbi:conserved hypothetical protein [Marinoscillum sp. 108]|nr:conserved hypothetical protein [Marinoscillum sp. 108]